MQDEAGEPACAGSHAQAAAASGADGSPRLLVHNLFALEAYHIAQVRDPLPPHACSRLASLNHRVSASKQHATKKQCTHGCAGQALEVPTLAASPCLVPYAAPSALAARLARQHPALLAALSNSPPGVSMASCSFPLPSRVSK